MTNEDIIVVKIGGSTLGSHDTTLEDLASLQRQGAALVVVHGGGAAITHWLQVHGVPTRFVGGLRATDAQALPVVVAVLAGLINKELVAAINAHGGRALGLSGADAGLVSARLLDPELGYVGLVEEVEVEVVHQLLGMGCMPVVAPVAALREGGCARPQLLNINADTMAGELARALRARKLVFLTDVPGVKDGMGGVLAHLSAAQAEALKATAAIDGGMIPKVEACLWAAEAGVRALIVGGRQPHALTAAVGGASMGTRIG